MENLKLRWAVVIAATALGLFWLAPNFVDKETSWLPKKKIVLGLDIQGGLHLVLGVDVKAVVHERTARLAKDLENTFRTDNIAVPSVTLANNEEIVIAASGDAVAKVKKVIDDNYGNVLQIIDDDDGKVHVKYYDAYIIDMKKQIVDQAIEVLRNRIDEFGVAEPNISAQGEDRILVQLPGVKDAAQAKELINRTAKLDFRLVSNELDGKLEQMVLEAENAHNIKLGGEDGLTYPEYFKKINEVLKDKLPPNTRIYFEKLGNAVSLEAGRRPYLLRLDSTLSGDLLDDAMITQGQFGEPKVSFSLNVEGTAIFKKMTEENVGRQIAIVLDDVVNSAPVVNEPIPSGQAQISLNTAGGYDNTMKEAKIIVTALRAGALPAALQQLEERTVGPSLGGDAVEKAKNAAVVGTVVVFIFFALYYRVGGVVADIALMLNFLLTLAILSSLGATLTLPGIAGLALTVGMSVDANIVIFERIREQLRAGLPQTAALKDGFANSYSAVLDSNITAILTCIVLAYYGTGPIRGFAVSLMTGITCSMFTAVFVSRVILDTLIVKFNMNVFSVKRA